MDLLQILRSIPAERLDREARVEFLRCYLAAANLQAAISVQDFCGEIERMARAKLGRSVLDPPDAPAR
ncbi:hypothetical protein D3C83_314390 [compost metagenome]